MGDALRFVGVPERISDPSAEKFVTVRTRGHGAIQRVIKDGKVPVAFTGYRVRAGQFIYSRIDARNGAFAVIPENLDGAVVSKDFPVFETNPQVDAEYLLHYMRSGRLESSIRAMSFGATNRQRITEDVFLNLPLALPPLPEQRRIAAILDQADTIRAKRRQVIERLDRLTQAIFREMFGDPRTWTTRWPMGSIGEMAESVQYGTSAKAGANGEWPILRMGNVTDDGRLDLGDLKYIDLPAIDVAKYTLRRGDLLFNRTNSKEKVGKAAVVDTDEPLAFAGYLVRVRMKPIHSPDFVSAYLASPHGVKIRQGMAKAAVNQANISASDMRKIRIALPPAEIQRKFSARTQSIREARSKQLDALALDNALFASLQSRAFRGEL